MSTETREAWLRGPVPGVPALLMPAAHAVLHASEDAQRALHGLDADAVWERPGGAPSVGYHVRHLIGALDRLFTYARGEALSEPQRAVLSAESGDPDPPPDGNALADDIARAAARAIDQLRATDAAALLDPRGVGRQQAPSTVLGLLFHGAEHAARHAGQAITTSRIVRGMATR